MIAIGQFFEVWSRSETKLNRKIGAKIKAGKLPMDNISGRMINKSIEIGQNHPDVKGRNYNPGEKSIKLGKVLNRRALEIDKKNSLIDPDTGYLKPR